MQGVYALRRKCSTEASRVRYSRVIRLPMNHLHYRQHHLFSITSLGQQVVLFNPELYFILGLPFRLASAWLQPTSDKINGIKRINFKNIGSKWKRRGPSGKLHFGI